MVKTRSASGNALFLILIAVALFAALSYAVTQSGRGSGTIDREQSLISASQITQFASTVRTTVTRMVLTGTVVAALRFDITAPVGVNEVFAKEGGGAVYQKSPANIGGATDWEFEDLSDPVNGFYVDGIGTNTDVTGREALTHLSPLSLVVCQQINKGLGLDATPLAPGDPIDFSDNMQDHYSTDAAIVAYPGEAFACFDNLAHGYTYYHVLIEQ